MSGWACHLGQTNNDFSPCPLKKDLDQPVTSYFKNATYNRGCGRFVNFLEYEFPKLNSLRTDFFLL